MDSVEIVTATEIKL